MALAQQLGLLVTIVFIFVSKSRTHESSNKKALEITALSQSSIKGSYLDRNSGRGIRFISTPETLFITTLPGDDPLLLANKRVGSLRLVTVGRNTFIQSDEQNSIDYAVPDGWQRVNTELIESPEGLKQLKKEAAEDDEGVHIATLQNSLRVLLSMPEVELIEHAAHALGEEERITGQDYPSVLPFYLAALQLQNLYLYTGIVRTAREWHYAAQNSNDSCFDTCPPCQEEDCLGLCGPSCRCWKWVCGDCCYHLGCYDHDVCCREKFVRTNCLFPFKFRCESPYYC